MRYRTRLGNLRMLVSRHEAGLMMLAVAAAFAIIVATLVVGGVLEERRWMIGFALLIVSFGARGAMLLASRRSA